jgi:hypothetical protein
VPGNADPGPEPVGTWGDGVRWLIVGPYPPEQGSGAAAAATMVRERLADGDSVLAISTRPSAAHLHLPLDGVRAMWELARIARAERAGGLWLRIEPGILLRPGTDRRRALLERLALARLLRRFETSVLDVGDVGLLPGGRAGRPVFAAATRFVTHAEQATATLIANGAPPAKVVQVDDGRQPAVVEGAATILAGPVAYPPPVVLRDLPGTRREIEAAVRARAAELHAARAAAVSSPDR